jgi:hypothetical protein
MKSNPNAGVRFGLVSAGIAICVLGARCARAQNALGDGQALDRNLRQGSGGRNDQVRDINALIRFNNSVVTGNASGGKSFRGDSGYRSTDDFRGALGSDALFNFRRDTAINAAPVVAGIRGTDALRYQFSLTTGQAPPATIGGLPDFSSGLARGANPVHASGVITSVEQRPITGSSLSSSLRSTADFGAQQTLRPAVLGYRQLQDGRQSYLTASPLLGVSEVTLGTAAGTTTAPENDPTRAGTPGLSGVEAIPSYINAPIGGVNDTRPGQLNTRVDAPKAVQDQFQRALQEGRTRPVQADPNDASKPNVEPVPENPGAAWERDIDRIRQFLRQEGPTPPAENGVLPDPNAKTEPPKPRTLEELISPETGRVNIEVLRALQATRPLLTNLAPDAPAPADTYAVHMTKGERLLRDGRFFDAEDAFVRALALTSGDPLANIGRVHAEIGAGLFLSAAANLKALYQENPTMIGTRYGANLNPSPERAASLSRQLRSIIGTPTSAMQREAAMLLAYIGYQINNPEQVKEGLGVMADKTFPDETSDVLLLGLLQRVWVEGRDLPPGTTPPAAKPAEPATPATPAPAEQNK